MRRAMPAGARRSRARLRGLARSVGSRSKRILAMASEPTLLYGSMAAVLPGLDVLVSRLPSLLRGLSVGLLCHQASVTRGLTPAAAALRSMRGVKLRRLFAPEHGLTGAAQDHAHVDAEPDPLTGLPVVSPYGKRPH